MERRLMLGNCEKMMTSISSNSNQWPQNNNQTPLDEQKSFMASSSAPNKAMDKTNRDPPHNLQPLKCPRCDSSNTKFCYYNNYSLTQPRHFCKACKRYWTRGGTLRNVPVGGGCRKNKRVKRQPSSGGDGSSSAASANPGVRPSLDLSPASNHVNSSLFYNPLELNFPFSSLGSTRVSSDNGGFDLHHQAQMNGLGIGFSSSSGLMPAELPDGDYRNGFKQIRDVTNASSPPLFSSTAGNNSIYFGSSSFASTSTMASLLASTLQQQKFGAAGLKVDVQDANSSGAPGLMPYAVAQMAGGDGGMGKLETKMEGENRLIWMNPNPNPIDQQIHNNNNSSDPASSLVWNTTNVGTWFDPSSNMGSSVPSLI